MTLTSQTKRNILLILICMSAFWIIATHFAKSDVREVQVDLTWDTVAPNIIDYKKWSVEPSDVGLLIDGYDLIEMTVGLLISLDSVEKVVIYAPEQEINLDTVVIVFIANQNPREITKFQTTEPIKEWQYSAFMVKDTKEDKYGVVILSKDSDRINEIEKAILRK